MVTCTYTEHWDDWLEQERRLTLKQDDSMEEKKQTLIKGQFLCCVIVTSC